MGRLVGCSYSHRKGKGRQSQFNSPGSSAIRRCSRGRTNDLGKQNKEVKKNRNIPLAHHSLPPAFQSFTLNTNAGGFQDLSMDIQSLGLAGCCERSAKDSVPALEDI